ncbi:SKP1-like protein 11 [Typha angustifolia]|uniref:SKP1-like protein 11 n=1 Tax=Typha angustifolia TaxID=59011 RepID=UPI003C2DEAA7
MSTETESEAVLPEDLELRGAAAAELLAEVVVSEGLISPEKRRRSKKTVFLKNSEGSLCEVDMTVAMESATIKRCLLDGKFKNGVIAISGFENEFFDIAIGFRKKTVGNDPSRSWEDMIMKDASIHPATLIDLISTANYLGIGGLKDLTCRTVAEMMKGKTSDTIRHLFYIVDDLSTSEKKVIEKAKMANK